jgi:hypothetical protein
MVETFDHNLLQPLTKHLLVELMIAASDQTSSG